MASFGTVEGSAILKVILRGPIRKILNVGTQYLAYLEKRSDMVRGKNVEIPILIGRAEGVGAMDEYANLPDAGYPVFEKIITSTKILTGHVVITKPMMVRSEGGDQNAYEPALPLITRETLSTLREDVERQAIRNDELGRGILAATGVTSASNTVVIAGATAVTNRILRKGMKIDIVNVTDDTVLASNRKITTVTGNPMTAIVIDGAAVTTTVNHRIARAGAWKKEITGIEGIVQAAGTPLYGLTNDEWGAHVDATSEAISSSVLRDMKSAIEVESGLDTSGGYFYLTSYKQRDKYGDTLLAKKEFVNTMDLKGGFGKTLSHENTPFVVSRYVDDDDLFFVPEQSLSLQRATDWEWIDDDGKVLSRIPNTLQFEAALMLMAEQVTDNRKAWGKHSNLT